MWRLVLTVVLWNTISSQPVTDDRQHDFVECCPCPGSSRAGLPDLGSAASSNSFPRAAAMDDCPCRLRDADSQGSPSLFIPRAVRPVRPLLTAEDPKEDVKPLLKPEVGLASSMLETLREVTDEEYKEALARDAARNAARVAELGEAQPDTAKSLVTIIVNHRGDEIRDAIPEASQPFETRCIPPSVQVRDAERSPVFKLQPSLLSKSSLDMDNGASEIQHSVVSLNKGLEGLRLKTSPSLLKLFPPRKAEGGNIQSLLKIKKNKLPKTTEDLPKTLDGSFNKLPSLKIHSLFRKNEDSSPIKPLSLSKPTSKLNITKIKTALARKPKVDKLGQSKSDDSNLSPSIIHEQFADPTENKNTTPFSLKSLWPTKTPLTLENLLNLKDVEIIPPNAPQIILPHLKLPTLRINKPGTKFVKQRKNEKLTKNCNTAKANDDDINVPKNGRIHTEILETIPYASEHSPVTVATNIATDKINTLPKKEMIKTQILDALPSASQNNEIVNLNALETSTPRLEEETTESDGDLEPQHIQEIVTESSNKLSKVNDENLDSNVENIDPNTENGDFNDNSQFVINDGINSRFEEFDIGPDTDYPVNEIDFSDSDLDVKSQGFDIEIEEDSANFAPPTITFTANDGDSVLIEELNQEANEFASVPKQEPQELVFGTEEIEGLGLGPQHGTDVSGDTVNSDLFFRGDSMDQDAVGETSNQNFHIASVGTPEDSNILTKERFMTEESSNSQDLEMTPIPKSDILSSIKERISLKLAALKKPNKHVISISRSADISNKNIEDIQKSSLNSDETIDVEPLTADTEQYIVEEKSTELTSNESNQVNMQDLQQMSDSLLRKSEATITPEIKNIERENTSADVTSDTNTSSMESEIESEAEAIEIEEEDNNEEANSDMESSATSLVETSDNNEASGEEEESIDIVINSEREDSDDITLNTERTSDTTCPSNLQEKSVSGEQVERSSSNVVDGGDIEMASGASETVFSTLPHQKSSGSPLLQQSIVVQPASLFPPLPSLDLSNVNIPSLDDIRERISDILDAKAAEDVETSSTDFDSIDDCPDSNPIMSSDASTSSLKSILPSLRPLEDINLDIFQINPQGSSLSAKLPSLNLNSFRTKLALPKTLELKPMKLQSALGGRNGGLLGATLTFGPDKTSSSRKTKPVTKLGSIFIRQGSDILGDSLSHIPSLEDIRSRMRENSMSLLNSPLTSPLEDTLKTTQALGNSLRSHTENTMRNIQQSLSSNLIEGRMNNAGEKLAKPEDLLEMVTSAHEDVKDKLYGIHVDLQDRLSSIHDSIFERSNLQIPTLQSPFLSGLGIGRLQDSPSIHSRARNDKKTPSPKLIVKKRKPTANISKTKSKDVNKIKPFKISKAASSLSPKSVEVPKLTPTSSKPPFLRPLQRDQNVKLQETKSIFGNDERQKPVRSKLRPFGVQTKVSNPTTSRPASIRTRPTIRFQSSADKEQPTRNSNQMKRKFKSFTNTDTRGFASEPKTVKVPPPVQPVEFLTSEESREKLQARPLPSSSSSLPEFTLGNPLIPRPHLPTIKPKAPIKLGSSKSTFTPLPKPTESPIVSKMREAIRIKFSRPTHPTDKLRKGDLKKPQAREDIMSSSASEAKSVSSKLQPMKENVAYKCKMVCVRE